MEKQNMAQGERTRRPSPRLERVVVRVGVPLALVLRVAREGRRRGRVRRNGVLQAGGRAGRRVGGWRRGEGSKEKWRVSLEEEMNAVAIEEST